MLVLSACSSSQPAAQYSPGPSQLFMHAQPCIQGAPVPGRLSPRRPAGLQQHDAFLLDSSCTAVQSRSQRLLRDQGIAYQCKRKFNKLDPHQHTRPDGWIQTSSCYTWPSILAAMVTCQSQTSTLLPRQPADPGPSSKLLSCRPRWAAPLN
jgi:hypothetical protein